jgi:hypothetical protein
LLFENVLYCHFVNIVSNIIQAAAQMKPFPIIVSNIMQAAAQVKPCLITGPIYSLGDISTSSDTCTDFPPIKIPIYEEVDYYGPGFVRSPAQQLKWEKLNRPRPEPDETTPEQAIAQQLKWQKLNRSELDTATPKQAITHSK